MPKKATARLSPYGPIGTPDGRAVFDKEWLEKKFALIDKSSALDKSIAARKSMEEAIRLLSLELEKPENIKANKRRLDTLITSGNDCLGKEHFQTVEDLATLIYTALMLKTDDPQTASQAHWARNSGDFLISLKALAGYIKNPPKPKVETLAARTRGEVLAAGTKSVAANEQALRDWFFKQPKTGTQGPPWYRIWDDTTPNHQGLVYEATKRMLGSFGITFNMERHEIQVHEIQPNLKKFGELMPLLVESYRLAPKQTSGISIDATEEEIAGVILAAFKSEANSANGIFLRESDFFFYKFIPSLEATARETSARALAAPSQRSKAETQLIGQGELNNIFEHSKSPQDAVHWVKKYFQFPKEALPTQAIIIGEEINLILNAIAKNNLTDLPKTLSTNQKIQLLYAAFQAGKDDGNSPWRQSKDFSRLLDYLKNSNSP